MKRNPNNTRQGAVLKPAATYACHVCGQPLPLDQSGVPVTSVWFNGRWYCPTCKNTRAKTSDTAGKEESDI